MMGNFFQAQGNAQIAGFGHSNGVGGFASLVPVDFEGDVNMEMDAQVDEDTDMTDVDSYTSSVFSPTSILFTTAPSTPPSMFTHALSTPNSTASSFAQMIAQTPTPANNAFAPLPDYSEQMEGVISTPPSAMATSDRPTAGVSSHKDGALSYSMQAAATQQQQQQPAQATRAPVPAPRPPHKNGTILFTVQTTTNTQQMPAQAAAVPNAPAKNGLIPFNLQPAPTQQLPTPPSTPPTTAATGYQPQSGVAPIKTQPHTLSQPAPVKSVAKPTVPKPAAPKPAAAEPLQATQAAKVQAASQAAQPAVSKPTATEPRQPQSQPAKSETKAPSSASIFKQPDWVSTAKVSSRWEKIRTWEETKTSAAVVFKPVNWPWTVKVPPRFENVKSWEETKAAMVERDLERDLEAIIQAIPLIHISDPNEWDWKLPTTFSMFFGSKTGYRHDSKPILKDIENAYSRPFAIGANWSSSIAPYPVTPAQPKLDVAGIQSILAKAQPLIEKLKKSDSCAHTAPERPNQNNKPSENTTAYPAAPLPATVSFFGREFSLSAPPTTQVAPSQEKPYEVGSDEDPNVDTEFDFAKCFSRTARTAVAPTPSSIPGSPPPSPSAQLLSEAAAADKALPSVETSPEVTGPSATDQSTATAPVAGAGGQPRVDNGLRYDEVYAVKMMRRMVTKTVPRLASQVMFPAPRFSKSDQEDEAKILVDEVLAREINEESIEDIAREYERKDTLSHTALEEAFGNWFEDFMLVELRLIAPDRLDPDEVEDLIDAVDRAIARYVDMHPPVDSLYSDDADESDDDYDSADSEGGDF